MVEDDPNDDGGAANIDSDQGLSLPKDALVIKSILRDMGATEHEPRVVNQLLEFMYGYITDVLEDAKMYSAHAGNSAISREDLKFAVQTKLDQTFTSPPPRDFLVDLAKQKNNATLPTLKTYSGARLPPDRYCLTSLNYRLIHHQTPQIKPRQGSSITASSYVLQSNAKLHVSQQAALLKRKWKDDYDDDYDV